MIEEDWSKRNIDNLNSDPYPVSPEIKEKEILEIGQFESEELAPGVVVIHNVFDLDQEKILSHIDSRVEVANKNRWKWITAEDGQEYAINEDGFRYRPEDVPSAPVRILDPVNPNTEKEIKDWFIYLEDQIYKALIKYIDYYPLMIGSIWWKTRGHILRYGDGGILGCHADNDTNYKVTKGIRYMPRGMVASRQTCGALLYLNDWVETEEELNGKNFTGGHLRFVHLNVSYKPKKGDVIFFPTNYIAAHDVERMGKGVRYSYLTFFGQGASDKSANIVISEPEESFEWCPPVWFNNIFDDYEYYCRSEHSRWENNAEKYGLEAGWNPVYQGREVAQYSKSHEAVELNKEDLEENKNKVEEHSEDLPEGPCNTVPQKIK
jgi:hypothetical protein